MSLDLFVISKKDAVPSSTEWADAVRREGFDVDLDQSFDTRESSGFRPCPTSDRGFEYTFGSLSASDLENFDISPQQQAQVKAFDSVAGLHYKTDADFEVARAVAAVLAKLTGGMVVEPESGAVMSASQALAWARGELEPQSSLPGYSKVQKQHLSRVTIAKLVLAVLFVSYLLIRWLKG